MSLLIERRKYLKMEPLLQRMNSSFITVRGDEVKNTNDILKYVLDNVINAMRSESSLFDILYESTYYGGSFFDGLKVGKPDEFDLDLKLVLPKLVCATIACTAEDGFVTLQMNGWHAFVKNTMQYNKYKGLEKLKDENNYLRYDYFLQWMESIVDLALNTISLSYHDEIINITTKKSGPAITLKIETDYFRFDVDLVGVFKLTTDKWPSRPYRANTNICEKNEFYVVPKPPKGNFSKRLWRLSFQNQEEPIIANKYFLKPALRLLKKLRDTRRHNIPSYFIKTIFLWEAEQHDVEFWNQSLSFIFMHMLITYRNYLARGEIPYFWNDNNNLLLNIKEQTLIDITYYLTHIINDIDRNINLAPENIAKYILTPTEYLQTRDYLNGGPEEPEILAIDGAPASNCTIL